MAWWRRDKNPPQPESSGPPDATPAAAPARRSWFGRPRVAADPAAAPGAPSAPPPTPKRGWFRRATPSAPEPASPIVTGAPRQGLFLQQPTPEPVANGGKPNGLFVVAGKSPVPPTASVAPGSPPPSEPKPTTDTAALWRVPRAVPTASPAAAAAPSTPATAPPVSPAAATPPTSADETPEPVLAADPATATAPTTARKPARPARQPTFTNINKDVESTPTRLGWLRRKRSSDKPAAGKPAAGKPGGGRPLDLPIRVLIGFLPGVTRKDALGYALGVGEKNNEQAGITYYDAFPYQGGFAYEVHEGGHGQAYLPAILDYFQSLGPYQPTQEAEVYVPTASKLVQVSRMREGLVAVLLPESATQIATEWLVPGPRLRPAIATRKPLLWAGLIILGVGVTAFTAASLGRIQPYAPAPAVPVEKADLSRFPLSQWPRILGVRSPEFVTALRYEQGQWRIVTSGQQAGGAAPAGDAASAAAVPPVPTPAPTPPSAAVGSP